MRLIVAGSRTWSDRSAVFSALDQLHREHPVSMVLSGGALGADQLGEEWAAERGVPVRRFVAEWRVHGRAAGPIRNQRMALAASALALFWDGGSRGSADMLRRARGAGIPVFEFLPASAPSLF